jgi:hypothetical protein
MQATEEHQNLVISTIDGQFLLYVLDHYHVEKSQEKDLNYTPSKCQVNLSTTLPNNNTDPFSLRSYKTYLDLGLSYNPTSSLTRHQTLPFVELALSHELVHHDSNTNFGHLNKIC